MKEFLGENWKTTLGGILSAFGLALVAAQDTLPAGYRWIGPCLAAVGVAFTGVTAKDSTTHSTQTQVKVATEVKKEATAEEIKALEAELKAKK